jgi:hypothetical protein
MDAEAVDYSRVEAQLAWLRQKWANRDRQHNYVNRKRRRAQRKAELAIREAEQKERLASASYYPEHPVGDIDGVRYCKCGCGKAIDLRGTRWKARFEDAAHRRRYEGIMRRRRRYVPPERRIGETVRGMKSAGIARELRYQALRELYGWIVVNFKEGDEFGLASLDFRGISPLLANSGRRRAVLKALVKVGLLAFEERNYFHFYTLTKVDLSVIDG